MKFRTLGLLLIFVLMAVFLVINWPTLSQVTSVNLIYKEIQAPLGVIVVCGFGILILLLALYTVWQQASVMMELRAASKEARRAHQLAEEADKSRLAEASKELRERFDKLEALTAARSDEMLSALRARAEQLEAALNAANKAQTDAREAAKSELMKEMADLRQKVSDTLPDTAQAREDEKKEKQVFGQLF